MSRPTWVDGAVLDRLCAHVTQSGQGEVIRPVAPYDGEPTAAVPMSTEGDVQRAAIEARHAQVAWTRRSHRHRAQVVLRFHDALLAKQDEVLDLIQWETGKARFDAWQEVVQVLNIARHYARRGEHYLAPKRLRGAIPGLTSVSEVRVPKGVVGVISPWNYPLYLGIGDVLPALLAGNSVLCKPDEQTVLTLLWARELMAQAGLPTAAWQILVGPGPVIGGALIDVVDHICFTGSTATGRLVGARAGGRLISCSLELGGKNPMVVRADADIAKTVDGLVSAAYSNTGQMCISIERVYVHDLVHDAFVAALTARVGSLVQAQTFDFSAQVGTLTSADQLKTTARHVDDAVAKGATVLVGGRARPGIGPLCYEPTVLTGVTPEMSVYGEETFGPVVSIYRVASDEEAVRRANEGRYGLSASVWSKDSAAASALARQVRAGAVNVNDGSGAAAASIEAPMGGMGDSGIGRRHGAEGIRRFTEPQTIAVQRLMPLGPPVSMPVEKFVARGNRQLALLRKLPVR